MITEFEKSNPENGKSNELYGLSSDTKPTTGILNAARFIEMDTGKLYLFDATNKQWLEWA